VNRWLQEGFDFVYNGNGQGVSKHSSKLNKLSLGDLKGVFLIPLMILGAATSIFLLEMVKICGRARVLSNRIVQNALFNDRYDG